MDRTVEMAIEELRDENKFFAKLEEHQLLTPLAIKYFCQRGEFSRNDYEAKVVDGAHDGGIDAVVMSDEREVETPVLIQAKHHKNITKDDCIQAARKIVNTCNAFADHRDGGYNKKLRKVVFDTVSDVTSLTESSRIMLVTSAEPSESIKRNIADELGNDGELKKYGPQIFFESDLVEAIREIEEPRYEVAEGTIEFDKDAGKLFYSVPGEDREKKCVIVNVRAQSLNKLEQLYRHDGLYGQNLREFIPDQKVDKVLRESIQKTPEEFWIK